MPILKKLLILAALVTAPLFAQVEGDIEVPYIPFEVKMGKGFSEVNANCLTCHSFGYVTNQGRQSESIDRLEKGQYLLPCPLFPVN